MIPSSPPTPEASDTPAAGNSPDGAKKHEMTWQEGIEETALELEVLSPAGPDTIQLSVMEYVFLWVTPFPDDFWTKVVAACVVWPATKVDAWFQFRRDIAIRAAKQKREPHPFRKPQELVPRAVDGRTVDMRCIALTDGKPWTDVRFARLVNHRFDSVAERWNERITKMEYEANLMAEYREQTTRSEP